MRLWEGRCGGFVPPFLSFRGGWNRLGSKQSPDVTRLGGGGEIISSRRVGL